ncbi:MAG: ribbon-helix-helix protein, CopG family [Armatimonadota bacterium]
MTETEKRKGGRPATGRAYPIKVFSYVDDELLRLLQELAKRGNRGQAEVLRQGIRALAEREGVE